MKIKTTIIINQWKNGFFPRHLLKISFIKRIIFRVQQPIIFVQMCSKNHTIDNIIITILFWIPYFFLSRKKYQKNILITNYKVKLLCKL